MNSSSAFFPYPHGLTKYIKYPPPFFYLMSVTGCLHRSTFCPLRIRWNNRHVWPMLELARSQKKKMPFLFSLLAPEHPLVHESMLMKEEESWEGAWWTSCASLYLNAIEAFLPLWHQTKGWHSFCFPFLLSLWYAFFLELRIITLGTYCASMFRSLISLFNRVSIIILILNHCMKMKQFAQHLTSNHLDICFYICENSSLYCL